jgi:hypothetical protein
MNASRLGHYLLHRWLGGLPHRVLPSDTQKFILYSVADFFNKAVYSVILQSILWNMYEDMNLFIPPMRSIWSDTKCLIDIEYLNGWISLRIKTLWTVSECWMFTENTNPFVIVVDIVVYI